MIKSKPQMLDALTSTRFIAAIGVVLSHYTADFTNNLGLKPPTPPWQYLLWQGGLGVDFFFLLSGFILTYTYALPHDGLRGTRRAFWVARLARIYPIYILGLALDLIPFLGRHHRLPGLISSAVSVPLLLHAWLPFAIDDRAWNPPSWSLSVEAFFYLVFPFILLWLTRQTRRQLTLVALASYVAFAVLPILLIVAATYHWHTVPWWLTYLTLRRG